MQILSKISKQVRALYFSIRNTYNIVWSFRGIFVALSGLLRKLPDDVDYLFICHDVHRHSKVDGKAYAPLLDPIVAELSTFGRCLTLAAPFSSLYGAQCFGDVRNYNFIVLHAIIKRAIFNRSLKLLTIEHDPLIKAYANMLSMIGPKIIIGIQPSIELCVAAKQQDITVYDMQHGVISDVNYYAEAKRRDFGQAGWPDFVLCWDEPSAFRLTKISKGNVDFLVLGNPGYHSKSGVRFQAEFDKQIEIVQKKREVGTLRMDVLVTLTYQDYGDRLSYLEKFNDKCFVEMGIPSELVDLINNNTDIFWRIRLHPTQIKFSLGKVHGYLKKKFNGAQNIDWINFSDCPLALSLTGCSGHITVDSAVAIDAAHNSVPTLLVGCEGWSNKDKVLTYFQEYITSGIMRFSESNELNNFSLEFFDDHDITSRKPSKLAAEMAFTGFIENLKSQVLKL